MKKSEGKAVRYNKWGYIFLIPFIAGICYFSADSADLVRFITAFLRIIWSGLTQVGPTFCWTCRTIKRFFRMADIWIYAKNTLIMWIMCFIPQIILSFITGSMVFGCEIEAERKQIL